MIIIYTRRVWSQIVDRLSEQFLARGLSWKQQETTPEDYEQPESDQRSEDSGVRRGGMRGDTCHYEALDRGQLLPEWPGVSIINSDGGENY